MASIRELRTRIRSVKNIEKITRAMKLVAAARLKRAQARVAGAKPYAEQMEAMMRRLAAAAPDVENPLLQVREERNIAVVVITSDRGLAGSYNTNLLRRAHELVRSRDPETVKMVLVGRKAIASFRRLPYPVADTRPTGSEPNLAEIRAIAAILRDLFERGEIDAVYVVFTNFISPGKIIPTTLQLLPLKTLSAEESGAEAAGDIIFEPDAASLLANLLPRYVDTQLYRTLVEAMASEHAARMISMSAATDNASTMIDTLTLTMNRARQASITREISEIVSGAEALK